MPRTPAQVRADLVSVLGLDLVGPSTGDPHEAETIEQAPSRWYLTGFLVPFEASEQQTCDPTAQEQIAQGTDGGGSDDDDPPEQASARKAHFPSSMGVSVLVPAEANSIEVTIEWGDYAPVEAGGDASASDEAPKSVRSHASAAWRRTPRREAVEVALRRGRQPGLDVRDSGLKLVVSTRAVGARASKLLPKGTRAVAVFLVNHRSPAADEQKDKGFVFQAKLTLRCAAGFCPRPNLRGFGARDWDEQVADLQYRDVNELAVGHGIATHAPVDPDNRCRTVETTWLPTAEVEKVVPGDADAELGMRALAELPSAAVLCAQLDRLIAAYGEWLEQQTGALGALDPARRKVGEELQRRAQVVRSRMNAGVDVLRNDEKVLEAFRIANRAMDRQARQRDPKYDALGESPRWRPFQLAFLLLNLRAVAQPSHADREIVDLLFFPTGGGKTEAYLGLAAFTLVLRRLRNPGLASAGVCVLMRYTLRLLTLDQLGRAATLICALELEREADVEKLGPWPFEIGLWVGQAATPNRMGRKGDNDRYSARARTNAFQGDDKKPSPIPIENCPWCGAKFTPRSFALLAHGRLNSDHPTDLRVQCMNRGCDFSGARSRTLPVLAVDEPIYRRLPAFLIATVDKFAALPWVGETGALLGHADRFDAEGFYGPAEPGRGRPLEHALLPPELVIQDELHLISGPLGTMVGLYETALDTLATRGEGAARVRPKIVASTATVRRAEKQIRALFARAEVEVFPPPGPDLRDSFFARTVPAASPDAPAPGTKNARLYLGVAAQGRSLKVVLLRTYLALLAAAQRHFGAEGGARVPDNPADPYMTLLGYFNSLRELGGSRRIVEDEVRSRLFGYSRRRREGEASAPFADRRIAYEVLELTSRVSTSKVADTKRRLAVLFSDDEHVDVALATNMISVGLDITRLGLMVVLGQPKTAAEYIQATSRVGRDDERPGLVVTLLNVHKPRDRSHYERFEAFHESFYRSVEATSVTPFAPRAVDRGLTGVAVALARHGIRELTPPRGALEVEAARPRLRFVGDALGARFAAHDPDASPDRIKEGREALERRAADLLDDWAHVAHDQRAVHADLQYQREEGGAPALLHEPLDPELEKLSRQWRRFRAQRSLRDVEPSVNLWVKTIDGLDVEAETEAQ